MYEQVLNIERMDHAIGLFGSLDHNVRLLEQAFSVSITVRNGEMKIAGSPNEVTDCVLAVQGLLNLLNSGEVLNDQNIDYVISMVKDGQEDRLAKLVDSDCICITAKGRPVKAKTIGQQNYVQAIRDNTVVLAIGPAGTGKTYLAVAQAVQAFRAKDVNRIILTRPAVEAGEKLGFLPGDIQQKVDPYLRPLYDALFDMLGAESFMKYQERGSIEVAPLAYMRGRTLDDSFIILDEAQNTTPEQMKMFLTRLGFRSKVVVTGDVTQIDLADGKRSGLMEAVSVLKNVDDIAVVTLGEKDVVRHKLVQSIIRAYDQYNQRKSREETKRRELDGKGKGHH